MGKTKKKAATGADAPETTTDYSAHFEANPDVDTLLVTSDGEAFTEANTQWAKSHAKSLEDKIITTVTRDGADDESDGDESEPEA